MRISRPVISAILCAALVASNSVAAEARQVSYGVSYAGGSLPTVKAGAGLKLYIDSDRLRFLKSGKEVVSIPAKSITEVTYGQEVHHRYGTAAAVAVVSLGVGAIVAFSKSKKHYIGLSWTGAPGEGGMVFQADKNEFRGILMAIEAVSGKKAGDGAAAQPVVAAGPSATMNDPPAPPAPPAAPPRNALAPASAGSATPVPAPAADPVKILIRFTSNPGNAEVAIDGDFWGSTPTDAILMQPGRHTIVMKERGFQRWERKITVAPGDTRTIHADLEPEAKDPSKPKISGLDSSN